MKVGWDWADKTHHVTVIADNGAVVDAFGLDHTEVGLAGAIQRLRGHAEAAKLPVAIERPEELVVERLLSAGHPVVPIHPNSFNAARPRWGASRALSLTQVTATGWQTSCEQTAIASGCSSPFRRIIDTFRPSAVPATTTSLQR
jgi:hypothetical protein